ncbi:MAG: nucleotide sugar dehydrogenase [Legionella sp.]|nr:nucleotide sugar dehydrogenase [Legionella sp.]
MNTIIVTIIGVGYVGLQNAITFSKTGLNVIGFDHNKDRIIELSRGFDRNRESFNFTCANLTFTDDINKIANANFYIISIPTPINEHLVPNIYPLKIAANEIGQIIKKGDVVILESTVFPGATRDLLIPILEEQSKLKSGIDFFVGYSSERINPGDTSHNLDNVSKVISGQNREALIKIQKFYQKIPKLVLHCAPSMEVAESSKLLENIQRDVNIALMNEYARIMEKMGISIHDVTDAAKTKWNFLPFKPGLVGGHCIPEDPYYLIYQANKVGISPNLIACARQTNEQFVNFIMDMAIKLLTKQGLSINNAKIAILGASFKPNVPDIRHSLSIVLYKNLEEMGMEVVICDPLCHKADLKLQWVELIQLDNCQAIILAQEHHELLKISINEYSQKIINNGIFIDIPGAFTKKALFRADIAYWSL